MPCFTRSPHGASDYSQAEISGGRPSKASGAPAEPSAENRGCRVVHDLFRAMVALALLSGVTCLGVTGSIEPEIRIEITAGIVVEAAPKWLGNMAKAVPPIAVDVLLAPPVL